MAFTMNQVKRKVSTKKDKQADIKSCYGTVYGNALLTPNVKIGIWQYCNYRFTNRNRGKFDEDVIREMIHELLSKICCKEYVNICIEDVIKNEAEILYHVKRAIGYGATRSLYYDIDIMQNFTAGLKMEITPPTKERMTENETVNYFKDVIMI